MSNPQNLNTNQNTFKDSSDNEKSVIDEFMLEEYKNISSAHFDLHQGLRQMFRFYLGVVAVPVTVFAFILKDSNRIISLGELPGVLNYILLLIAIVGFLMFLTIINIRFDIIFYTRTVNGTRNYFIELDKELRRKRNLLARNLREFLLLPGDMRFPSYTETLKAYWWQFLMIGVINSIYFLAGIKNLTLRSWKFSILVGIGFFALHAIFYYFLGSRKDKDTDKMLKDAKGKGIGSIPQVLENESKQTA